MDAVRRRIPSLATTTASVLLPPDTGVLVAPESGPSEGEGAAAGGDAAMRDGAASAAHGRGQQGTSSDDFSAGGVREGG